MSSIEKTTKEKLLDKLYSLSHDVIWDIEANREIEGKSFIMPNDLNRITELIDDISNDVEKAIDQTRKETIRNEIEYWEGVFDNRPKDRDLESDNIAQNFARIEIERLQSLINLLK